MATGSFVVAPLDQLFMMWSAVNRVARAGALIVADQKVLPMKALKAPTVNAALQYRELLGRVCTNLGQVCLPRGD